MILQETYKLSNGVEIPKLGLGTWMIDDDNVAEAVASAVDLGYRHIDTAQAYGNERGVGAGVRKSGVPRREIFVTSKLDAGHKTYDAAKRAIEQSLETLDVDHIDLLLIHSPKPWEAFGGDERFFEGNLAAWKAMEGACEAGALRAIGVSNFEQEDLENLLGAANVKPMLNQILAHISNTPFDLIDYLKRNGLAVAAYSPIGHGQVLNNGEVAAMALKYEVSIPQLCLRYCLQLDLIPLPKTANPDHMRTNADLDFEIDAADMATLRNTAPIKDYGKASVFPVFQRG